MRRRRIRGRRLAVRTVTLFVGIALLNMLVSSVASVQAGEPPLQVGVREIVMEEGTPDEQLEIARIMSDILSQAIERSLSEDRGYYVWISRLNALPGEMELAMEADSLRGEGLRFVVSSSMSFSERGYVLRAQTFDLQGRGEEGLPTSMGIATAIMSGIADFDEIEKKIHRLSIRITRRMTGEASPERKVFFWCVLPDDMTDSHLVTCSRRLTLEMPYYLSENEELLNEYVVAGLSPRDFKRECWGGASVRRTDRDVTPLEQYDFLISGQMRWIGEREAFQLRLLIDAPASRHSVPLEPIQVPVELEETQLAEIAGAIARGLREAVDRRELEPMPRR